MDIVGFAVIKKDATTCKGANNPNEFMGEICSVIEFGHDGDVLVLNPKGTALAMFEKCDVTTSFKCGYSSGVVTPPDLEVFHQMAYVVKATTRKGGYNKLVRNMVIAASLHKGEFNDNLLWSKQ